MSPAVTRSAKEQLLDLSSALGREDRELAILGEGNTSALEDDAIFWVKASGSNLAALTPEGLTLCQLATLIMLLDGDYDAAAVESHLLASRVDSDARKPSEEAMFHAWLLTRPGVKFVGHTHPLAVNALLCSPRAEDFAHKRMFPDEIVCCGARSASFPAAIPG